MKTTTDKAQPVAYRVRLAGDDPEEWQPLTVARALDFIDRKDYECQPLYDTPAPVDGLAQAAEEVMRISDRDHEAWHRLRAELAAYRGDDNG
jgi:hypothetical protein